MNPLAKKIESSKRAYLVETGEIIPRDLATKETTDIEISIVSKLPFQVQQSNYYTAFDFFS